MTIEQFLASLEGVTRADAIAQIEGWLEASERWPERPDADRERPALLAALYALRSGKRPAEVFRGRMP